MHFLNFKSSGVNKRVNQLWGCVWGAVVAELWNHRNRKIFKNGRTDYIEIFTMVQLKVWSWMLSKIHSVGFSYSNWCLEPLVCMRFVRNC